MSKSKRLGMRTTLSLISLPMVTALNRSAMGISMPMTAPPMPMAAPPMPTHGKRMKAEKRRQGKQLRHGKKA